MYIELSVSFQVLCNGSTKHSWSCKVSVIKSLKGKTLSNKLPYGKYLPWSTYDWNDRRLLRGILIHSCHDEFGYWFINIWSGQHFSLKKNICSILQKSLPRGPSDFRWISADHKRVETNPPNLGDTYLAPQVALPSLFLILHKDQSLGKKWGHEVKYSGTIWSGAAWPFCVTGKIHFPVVTPQA